ncbi:MAG TPA: coiled coil domain-containing protein [Moraxellaceae bacterium]|nr:coiled coil domain-containing protein [Moraxellaceae bacterium]
MNDKELYAQKYQAQLDGWSADISKLKAKAMGAKADAQIDMNKMVAELEEKVGVANSKLAELSAAGEEAWDKVKKNVETTWDDLKVSVTSAVEKLKS